MAHRLAALGKRGRPTTAAFEHQLADQLLQLQADLKGGNYAPLPYTHFMIHEPKRRRISAAAFRDRVVHHALCLMVEPRFERVFTPDSYANRVGKGTHAAITRLAQFARGHRYVLRADIRQHFPSIDHALLLQALQSHIAEDDVMALIATIVVSGDLAAGDDTPTQHFFAGDDSQSARRPCGLPIGNLTSQFWSNCYLHPLDLFVKRELSCKAYLRYVDDFALFSDCKSELWAWKTALRERLAKLRLTMHEHSTQVAPTAAGIPWLGFVVYPTHRLVKARKVRHASRQLGALYEAWRCGDTSFAEFDVAVQGWINHVRQADSWGLREHVLAPYTLPAGFEPHYAGRIRQGR
jgi:RNA-directed DNA polymerase